MFETSKRYIYEYYIFFTTGEENETEPKWVHKLIDLQMYVNTTVFVIYCRVIKIYIPEILHVKIGSDNVN